MLTTFKYWRKEMSKGSRAKPKWRSRLSWWSKNMPDKEMSRSH
jgi:hypothetical protein